MSTVFRYIYHQHFFHCLSFFLSFTPTHTHTHAHAHTHKWCQCYHCMDSLLHPAGCWAESDRWCFRTRCCARVSVLCSTDSTRHTPDKDIHTTHLHTHTNLLKKHAFSNSTEFMWNCLKESGCLFIIFCTCLFMFKECPPWAVILRMRVLALGMKSSTCNVDRAILKNCPTKAE